MKSNSIQFISCVVGLSVLIVIIMMIIGSMPPKEYISEPFTIKVSKDMNISSVADKLYSYHVISSKFLFKVAAVVFSRNHGIFAGDYRFTERQNLFTIASRMVKGEQGQPKVKITIPEGTNVYDMAYIYLRGLSDFNAPRFVSLAQKYEGYLFPDTYYFLANAGPEEIIKTMRDNFNEKVKTIEPQIKAFNKPFSQILIMASIVEEEARADESRKIVAGILWKRLAKDMLLQVDAPFYYTTGKAGGFTLDDLKVNSPYNTYINKGLPKSPISNPGLGAILDTVTPIETAYFFYLTGNDGQMRYAVDFNKHIENKNQYLK
jgi:UPF0755 protein